ncbi:hypothetical protein NDU88_003443 [Pleurodeles waltl]|uniref:Uncharacterized protein n=1 Tax=Pleurodeles waltl TaxID=8319 RepID=A0AAV7W261_PLEWA|nr:hypothetical protein NDU88_003443 [Pleurodeles waltl]
MEKSTRRTSARPEGEQQRKLALEEKEDVKGEIETQIFEEAEENGAEAAEAERAQEIDSPAKLTQNRRTSEPPAMSQEGRGY